MKVAISSLFNLFAYPFEKKQMPLHRLTIKEFSGVHPLSKAKVVVAVCAICVLCVNYPIQAQHNKQQTTEQVEKQSIPDMIGFAKKKLPAYFPEEVEYFKHIFEIIDNAGALTQRIANQNLDKYTQQFSNEEDRLIAILMAIELANKETNFIEKYENQEDVDMRMLAAYDFLDGMQNDFKEERRKSDERLKKIKDERVELLKQLDVALQGYEEALRDKNPETVKTSRDLQESLRWYIETMEELQKAYPERKIPLHVQKLIEQLPQKSNGK